MMQEGLHIGLAAWIGEQRSTGSFPVYPASPIVTELVNLEAVQNATDLAKAAEFARLANFIPRQGQVADIFSSLAILWNVHRDILGRMEFATEPWTGEERAQYQTARTILYTTDASGRPAPSDKLQLYTELQHTYEDLGSSGASQADIDQALANWTVMGYKNEVETALAILLRLAGRSSRTQADLEQASLQDERLRVSGELPFASTYFAPLSALARQTWMAAKVSFEDLDRAVGKDPMSSAWKGFLANRTGEVSFDYAVIHCLRPWYTPALYQADDWRLRPEGAPVSKGNGTGGELPAYVDALYLASVKDVTITPVPPGPRPWPPIRIFPRPELVADLEPRPNRLLVRPKALGIGGPSTGVVAGGKALPVGATAGSISHSALASGGANLQFTALSSGTVRRLTAVDSGQRFAVAQAYLAGRRPPDVSAPSTDTTIYVVGFGCTKIPFAPNPNANYTWS